MLIPLRDLERLERELGRFLGLVAKYHPGLLEGGAQERVDPATETIRNAAKTLTEISAWVPYRMRCRKDPFVQEMD